MERPGFKVTSEVKVPLQYRDLCLDIGCRLDLSIEDVVVVENKVVESILPVHGAQILTYLELTGCRLGYLINWNVSLMKRGIHRFALRLWRLVMTAPTLVLLATGHNGTAEMGRTLRLRGA
jgi:GxxExxY protein